MPEETFRWVITGAVAIATISFVVIAIVAIAIYRSMRQVRTRVDDVAGRVEPLIDRVRLIADENAPKIGVIATNVESVSAHALTVSVNVRDISDVARDQAVRFGEVGRDIADRTRAQAARVDAAIDETVMQVQNAGENMKQSMMKPVRRASAVVAGVRAAVSTYAAGQRTRIDHIAQDEEMFI